MNIRTLGSIALAAAIVVSCSKSEPAPAVTKTKAQKDSAIANSGLPGSQGVAKAMQAADSAKARQAALDSIKP